MTAMPLVIFALNQSYAGSRMPLLRGQEQGASCGLPQVLPVLISTPAASTVSGRRLEAKQSLSVDRLLLARIGARDHRLYRRLQSRARAASASLARASCIRAC